MENFDTVLSLLRGKDWESIWQGLELASKFVGEFEAHFDCTLENCEVLAKFLQDKDLPAVKMHLLENTFLILKNLGL